MARGARRPEARAAPRGGGFRRLPDTIVRLLDPAARRRGLAGAGILTQWAAIVGPELAARTQPIRLGRAGDGSGGVLHLRVDGAAALELQHMAPQVLERINGYFGYPAAGALRLVQAPLPRRVLRPPRQLRALGAGELGAIERALRPVVDGRLRAALAGLGAAIAGAPPAPERWR